MQSSHTRLDWPVKGDASFVQGSQLDPLLEPFDGETCLRLCWLQITVLAERSLVTRDQPCPDHQVCRRLAFALWLRCSGRLSDKDHRLNRHLNPTEGGITCCAFN
ncbi:MAG: hypothetical protein JO352_03175 [Chloroflexi bacterium]|nr:hypothetical protein [Chloroflexota bacterium]MBV9599789.1 hypothetical protein [Chloroflexota bacterium]